MEPTPKGRVLIVDDEEQLRDAYGEILKDAGYEVETAANAAQAIYVLDLLKRSELDVVLSDIMMPGISGVQLLRAVRERDLDLPVILMTGHPTVDTAAHAVEYGALRYLLKPVKMDLLVATVGDATRLRRLARVKRELADELGDGTRLVGDRAGLEASFERALQSLSMAYQPIVRAAGDLYGYEALVRTGEASLPHPKALFNAAERLGRLPQLGGAIRAGVARAVSRIPRELALFVNLHSSELTDETLYEADGALTAAARGVVLEITELAALDDIPEVRARVRALKDLGFRIALDDLGAGYAGLTSFTVLEPHIVKLDMTLVRGVDSEPIKRRLIKSMTSLCKESGILVVAEGVETKAEHDAVVELGCDLVQGFLIGRPDKLPNA
jgi:EAL domain-containing protein (putative c-di-GMP-specific phosphodiesterase class I)/ActR/RegA family two-component response regulator